MNEKTQHVAKGRDPDELLVEIGKSILGKAILFSLIAHVVVIGGTSFKLYRDWGRYGLHAPSAIKGLKAQEKREADDLRRQEAVAQRAASAASAATNAPAATGAPAAASPAGQETESGKVTPPEVQPLPPADGFILGKEMGLDP